MMLLIRMLLIRFVGATQGVEPGRDEVSAGYKSHETAGCADKSYVDPGVSITLALRCIIA